MYIPRHLIDDGGDGYNNYITLSAGKKAIDRYLDDPWWDAYGY